MYKKWQVRGMFTSTHQWVTNQARANKKEWVFEGKKKEEGIK